MKILDKEIKLVIFDMDGTLIDSTGIWGKIDKEFFERRGYDKVPDDYALEIVHMGLEKGAEMTVERYGVPGDTPESVIKEWQDASMEEYLYRIQLKPYAKEALSYFKKQGIPVALATANDKELYEPCLKRLGLDKEFDYILDVRTVKEGKSSPKIYNAISEKFGFVPNETLVFEDTLMGLKTAYKAGYIVFAIDDEASNCALDEKKKHCHKYLLSFEELFK